MFLVQLYRIIWKYKDWFFTVFVVPTFLLWYVCLWRQCRKRRWWSSWLHTHSWTVQRLSGTNAIKPPSLPLTFSFFSLPFLSPSPCPPVSLYFLSHSLASLWTSLERLICVVYPRGSVSHCRCSPLKWEWRLKEPNQGHEFKNTRADSVLCKIAAL